MARWLQLALTPRILNALAGLACFAALGIALLEQYLLALEPCPLCIAQRLVVIVGGALLLLAAAHNPAQVGFRIYAALSALVMLTGIGIAGRHVWLQHLPADQVPACGPGLDYMLDVFPLQDVVNMVLRGSGECAAVDWTFLGLSIPEQTLIFFVGMLAICIAQLVRKLPAS